MAGMTAKQKFQRGDHVVTSSEYEARLRMQSRRGLVVGFGRSDTLVRVLVDGIKCPESYHMDFWSVEART